MRRAAAAVAVTVTGLWLVLSFKSSPAKRVSAPTTSAAPPATQGTGPGATSPSSSTTVAGGGGSRTVDGPVVSMQYGDVQVAVVLQGNKIVDVKALQLPFDRPRSQYISEQAAPLLHDEVIQAQSAQIDGVSGATFTSEAYDESLQAAIDRAHA